MIYAPLKCRRRARRLAKQAGRILYNRVRFRPVVMRERTLPWFRGGAEQVR